MHVMQRVREILIRAHVWGNHTTRLGTTICTKLCSSCTLKVASGVLIAIAEFDGERVKFRTPAHSC